MAHKEVTVVGIDREGWESILSRVARQELTNPRSVAAFNSGKPDMYGKLIYNEKEEDAALQRDIDKIRTSVKCERVDFGIVGKEPERPKYISPFFKMAKGYSPPVVPNVGITNGLIRKMESDVKVKLGELGVAVNELSPMIQGCLAEFVSDLDVQLDSVDSRLKKIEEYITKPRSLWERIFKC